MTAFVVQPARRVLACSAGADFNPIAASDVIISGTILGWTPELPAAAPFTTVVVDIEVEDVLKGEVGPRLTAVDTASLHTETQQWHGGGGPCGAFSADPTGQFVFMGLSLDENGWLATSLPLTFYIGERSEFAGVRYERIAEVLAPLGLTRLPATGQGGTAEARAVDSGLLAVAAVLMAAGLSSLRLLRRTQ
jgi:hypothetical protein